MRVISGSARGCKLQPVPGMDTRPTTDRVKESVFNIIQSWVRGADVLDLFAGTGQLGIEALSRGAAHCDFVEHSRVAMKIMQKNIAAARVGDCASTHLMEFTRFISSCEKNKYGVILLDPPYGGKIMEQALLFINRFDILAPSGIILCESAVTDTFAVPFAAGREYRYGMTRITVLHGREQKADMI